MPRRFTPKVITANHLHGGHPVWLTETDDWADSIAQAELIDDEAHAQIRLIDAQGFADLVVGPYLADARAGTAGPEPTHTREALRSSGPSHYTSEVAHV